MRAPQISAGAFRRLVAITFALTIALVIVGGVVRISDSGLGCGPAGSGVHGWPLCGGRVVPVIDTHQVVEYTHRALASAVGVLLLVLAAFAWLRFRDDRDVVRLSTIAVLLVLAEGILGGATVEHDLHPGLVAAHLGISMLILGTLLALLFACSRRPDVPAIGRSTLWFAIAAPFVTWTTIVAGGYVAGTDKYGTLSGPMGDGAHMACGKEFPGCNGELFPFGQSYPVDVQLVHRVLMYVTAVVVILFAMRIFDGAVNPRARKFAMWAVLVLCAQIVLGAMNVWLGEHRVLILAHLAMGTTLWLTVLGATLSTVAVPRGAAAPAQAPAPG